MTRTRIKICGITRADDALAAQAAGCDAVGFVFWNHSPRCIGIDDAAAIVDKLSSMLTTVGVFVSPTPEEVESTCRRAGLSAAQLCGDLTDDSWADVAERVRLIRALEATACLSLQDEPMHVFRDILVDHHTANSPGGTGEAFDWSVLQGGEWPERLWLAGGLSPANVGDAIATVQPFAVDVSTGVEERPGIKSHDKIREFVAAVQAADLALHND